MMALAGGKHRRHDHRAGMDGTALERIVEILAVRRCAIDEGRARRRQRARVSDHCAGPVIVGTSERAFDIILLARGDTETNDVDQKVLAFARGHFRQHARLQRRDLLRKRFGDGDFRKL
jgi:hypothetical protein